MPTETQLVRDELAKWQRWVIKKVKAGKLGRGREFEAIHIPAALQGAVEGALEAVESVESVADVFANALTWGGYP